MSLFLLHEVARRRASHHQVTATTSAFAGSADLISDGVKYHQIGSAIPGPSAALFVLPSRYETSPLTLLEAFCHAKPVIIFGIDELAWVSDTACLKVKPFDTCQLVEAVRTLANDPAKARSLGVAAKEFAHDFSWDSIASRYEEFIVKTGQLHQT